MDSLSDETWEVVICGTGLQQSLLALALSRSDKRILHLDPNDYYGEHEAAFSLQEADSWVEHVAATHAVGQTGHAGDAGSNSNTDPAAGSSGDGASSRKTSKLFQRASVWKHPDAAAKGLSFPRAYTLALAPQIIHTRSKLLSQLVSSRAYRQVEFQAVGSFFVYEAGEAGSEAQLARIPSSREDVFMAQSIPTRSKRALMKFLKFVIDYESEEQRPVWQEHADRALLEFLRAEFKVDDKLCKYLLALTLALTDAVTVKEGLATINRHLTSMGLFGPGFCAVYPKWGGISEIAQIGCRAGAVGGGIYMLDTGMERDDTAEGDELAIRLSNGITVRTKNLVSSQQEPGSDSQSISRLVAVVNSPLTSLFETVVEGAPTPAVAVVAFPTGELGSTQPIYALVHSSETGECPAGQTVIYLTTQTTPTTAQALETALDALLRAAAPASTVLYKLAYEQSASARTPERATDAPVYAFPSPAALGLAFDDACLEAVHDAWKMVVGEPGEAGAQYMVFSDREGVGDDDDVYD